MFRTRGPSGEGGDAPKGPRREPRPPAGQRRARCPGPGTIGLGVHGVHGVHLVRDVVVRGGSTPTTDPTDPDELGPDILAVEYPPTGW
ncbi:hypothetical protein TOK_2150 [Pseudonocardia sp. N23]|nr:hypothetical protein TOK_2150 [Pseudonocardia sp. N23]